MRNRKEMVWRRCQKKVVDVMVWTVMSYRVKVWGWNERERMEKMQQRYGRWILGLDWETSGYTG